MTITISIT